MIERTQSRFFSWHLVKLLAAAKPPRRTPMLNLLKGRSVWMSRGAVSASRASRDIDRQIVLSCRKLVEQRLGLLQIKRIEAFGEPVVDRGEQIASLFPLVLVAPEPAMLIVARNSKD